MPTYSQMANARAQTIRKNFRRKWLAFLRRDGDWHTRARISVRDEVTQALAMCPDEITIVCSRVDPAERRVMVMTIREALYQNPYITIHIISHV